MHFSPTDQELYAAAKKTLQHFFLPEKHFIAAAIRGKSGTIYTGFNVKTTTSRASVCAEMVALAEGLKQGEKEFKELIVLATNECDNKVEPVIISPCGICREALCDYAPKAEIVIGSLDHPYKVKVSDLLPFPYKKCA